MVPRGHAAIWRAQRRACPARHTTTAPRLRQDWEDFAKTASKPRLLAVPVLLALFGNPLDRDHALAFGGVEDDHALGRAAGDADAVDRAADQLAAVGHQHDLVALLDREGGDQPAVLARSTAMATMPLPPRPVMRYS